MSLFKIIWSAQYQPEAESEAIYDRLLPGI